MATKHAAADNPRNFVLRLAAVVVAPALLYWVYTTVLENRALAALQQIQTQSQSSLAKIAVDQQRRERERSERAEAARVAEANRQRALLDAEQLRQQGERRKDAAWARYYVAPAACDKPATWEFQVECGNRYMRARRAFEAEWSKTQVAPETAPAAPAPAGAS